MKNIPNINYKITIEDPWNKSILIKARWALIWKTEFVDKN